MAPRHTRGVGGGGISCDGASLVSCPTNQELVCWFLFPTPCLRRHPPNFIPFPPGASEGLRGVGLLPLPQTQKCQHFQVTWKAKVARFRVTNNLVKERASNGVSSCGCSSGSRHPGKGWVRPKQAWVGIGVRI